VDEVSRHDRRDTTALHVGGQTDENAAISPHAKNTSEALDETSSLPESAKERRAATVSLGDKPLMVLSAGARDPLPGASQEQSDRFNEAWTKSGADLTRLSRNSEHIIAEDSTHNIQSDDPELVIDAIHQVVEAVRNGGSV
jgi:pimeloyl-ACP methyl ester carboxylesterase